MTSHPEYYTPQPYDPYADDEPQGGWFNSDGYIPRQPQGHDDPQGRARGHHPGQDHGQDHGQDYGHGQAHGHGHAQARGPGHGQAHGPGPGQDHGHGQDHGYDPGPAVSQGYDTPEGYDYDPRTYPYQQPDDQETFALRTVPEAAAPAAPAYHVPQTPEVGWDMAASRRRAWVSRAVLLFVLTVQAVLSLRLANTAFQDEALYLAAGHAELRHLLHGTPLPVDYAAYFSGSPQLYPVLAAAVDSRFGLTGARLTSLAFMLGTTALLYSFTRRLFNERAALAGAALFAVVQSTVVMGYFATYDAAAVFLLAMATWIVVRTDRAPVAAVLLAAPVAVLAVGVKYAAGLYLPTIVVLTLLTGWPHKGGKAFVRMLLLALGIGALLGAGVYATDLLAGVRQTTTDRAHGADSTAFLLQRSAEWGGLMFLTAVGGAVSYVRRSRMNESPAAQRLGSPGRRWRFLLGLVLCGTALLAPAYQVHLGTVVSLFKHVGFGLLFAAPMAGVGVTRLIGAHFRYPQLGIMLWTATLCLGISQADWRYGVWPDSTKMIQVVDSHVDRKGHYLASTPEVPVYYLRDKTSHRQWQGVFALEYTDRKGARHSGDDAYRAALRDGEYDLIVLDGLTNPRVDAVIADAVEGNRHYRLLADLPFRNSSGTGHYRIWTKTS
ncbi:glycosyltransferase family 39 protein [Streptomyces sp. SID161]|uniref:glycosyltransferase family 39 protein n=1 Tax=Streptomyces sp. SID161 TaxID=2690251 RepID=UPI00136D2A07|nr:glycosyltransferase family 39 protein [Streptomyces sp. SID161]MYW45766.1 phospholipid carrier-dependent glycosyltransferase [Streptomyces sp. SID161]